MRKRNSWYNKKLKFSLVNTGINKLRSIRTEYTEITLVSGQDARKVAVADYSRHSNEENCILSYSLGPTMPS